MLKQNFNYENICVIVHGDDTDDRDIFAEEDIKFWQETLQSTIKNFIVTNNMTLDRGMTRVLGLKTIYRQNAENYATIYATYATGYFNSAFLDYRIIREDEGDVERKIKNNTIEKQLLHAQASISGTLKSFGTEVRKVVSLGNKEVQYKKV